MDREKEKYVYSVFESIAPGYDPANRRISLGMQSRWKRKSVALLAAGLPPDAAILDLGCGTGDMLLLLHEVLPEASLTGLDFSPAMLAEAGKRCAGIPGLRFQEGNACELPMEEGTFDGVSMSFALRNTASYDAAVSEAFRVLRPGGVFLCVDSFVPRNRLVRPFYRAYFSFLMPLLGGGRKHFREYRWLSRSTEAFLSPDALLELFHSRGFRSVRLKRYCFGACCALLGVKGGPAPGCPDE